MSNFHYNESLGRYEQSFEGPLVYAKVRKKDGVAFIDYVEAAPELRGGGAAGKFMQQLMEAIRAEGLKAQPICGYAASWIRRHSNEYQDLSP